MSPVLLSLPTLPQHMSLLGRFISGSMSYAMHRHTTVQYHSGEVRNVKISMYQSNYIPPISSGLFLIFVVRILCYETLSVHPRLRVEIQIHFSSFFLICTFIYTVYLMHTFMHILSNLHNAPLTRASLCIFLQLYSCQLFAF